MNEFITSLLPYVLEGGLVATITALVTIKQVKRKATLENDGLSIQNVKEIIELLREENAQRKEETSQFHKMYEEERVKREDVQEENTAAKMMMCVHLGCVLRRPLSGQGDQWYSTHKSDPSLGADYMPINRLLQQYGKGSKKEGEEKVFE